MDAEGKIYKSIPDNHRLKPVLRSSRRRFAEIFGRKTRKDDLLFFESVLESSEDFWQNVKKIGKQAQVRDELMFAWRRSGFIVGEHSIDLMPDVDFQQWDAAVLEFRKLKRKGIDPYHVFTYLDGKEFELYKLLLSKLDNIIIAIGLSLARIVKIKDHPDFYRVQLCIRGLRALRTIRKMYENRYDDDCLAICRSVYESYLRVKFLRLAPEDYKRFEAITLLGVGVYVPKIRKSGKIDRSICVDPETNEEFSIEISNREIIDKSDFSLEEELYFDIYPFLSSFVHPDISADSIRMWQSQAIDLDHEGDPVSAIVLVMSTAILLAAEMLEADFVSRAGKADIKYVIRNCSNSVVSLITCDSLLQRGNVPPSVYKMHGLELVLKATA